MSLDATPNLHFDRHLGRFSFSVSLDATPNFDFDRRLGRPISNFPNLSVADNFGKNGEHDCYKRLGDFLLRNELGTTRAFGKSPKLNERETQRKNKPKNSRKYVAKSLANNCMNFGLPVPTE